MVNKDLLDLAPFACDELRPLMLVDQVKLHLLDHVFHLVVMRLGGFVLQMDIV